MYTSCTFVLIKKYEYVGVRLLQNIRKTGPYTSDELFSFNRKSVRVSQ